MPLVSTGPDCQAAAAAAAPGNAAGYAAAAAAVAACRPTVSSHPAAQGHHQAQPCTPPAALVAPAALLVVLLLSGTTNCGPRLSLWPLAATHQVAWTLGRACTNLQQIRAAGAVVHHWCERIIGASLV